MKSLSGSRRQRDGTSATSSINDANNNNNNNIFTSAPSDSLVKNHNIISTMFQGSPVKINNPLDFFNAYCDQKHLHLSLSNNNNRSSDFWEKTFPVDWSTKKMREAVQNKKLRHKVDVNVVRYDHKEKRRIDFMETMSEETHPEAFDDDTLPPLITLKDFDFALKNGWSIRFLRPQEHSQTDIISKIMFKLEEELQCSCGINSYWTPGGGQGFAPHYDDVDVFLLQLEGQKHWRLHACPTPGDWLSRVSSEDFKPEDISKPVLDTVLRKGELLYMPRGTIHQGDTTHVGKLNDPNEPHSLHVTFSAFQMHTWADLIRETYNYRVEFSAANNVSLRHSLPLGWRTVMGSLANQTMMGEHAMKLTPEQQTLRMELQKKMRGFFAEIHSALMSKDGILDKGIDAMARKVLERRQPVPIDENNNNNNNDSQNISTITTIKNPTQIRLTWKESVRFVMLVDEVRVYHCGGNSIICLGPRDHRENCKAQWESDENSSSSSVLPSAAAGFLRLDIGFAPAVAKILSKSPEWIDLESLPDLCFDPKMSQNEIDQNGLIPCEESRQMVDALLATCCFEVK